MKCAKCFQKFPGDSIISTLLLVSFFMLGVETAYANVPIGAAAFLAYPTVSYITSSAVALVIAVAIESLVFWKITKFKPLKVLSAVFSANLVSSLFGVVVVFSFGSSTGFYILWLPLAYALGRMFKKLCEDTDCLHKTRKFHFIIFLLFLFVCVVFGTLLLPATSTSSYYKSIRLNINLIATYSAVMITLGFVMTNLIEAYVINRILSGSRDAAGRLIVKGVLAMNLCSYLILSAVYGKSIFGYVLRAV